MEISQFVPLGISLISLGISLFSYLNPRKPGGSIQWEVLKGTSNNDIIVKNVGSQSASHLVIKVKSGIGDEEFMRELSYPNDFYVFTCFRTLQVPDIKLEIHWRSRFLKLKRVRFFIL